MVRLRRATDEAVARLSDRTASCLQHEEEDPSISRW